MNLKQLEELSPYETLADFNESFAEISKRVKKEFGNKEWFWLKELKNYAAKYHGVAYPKFETLEKAVIKKYGKIRVPTRSTFTRMIRKAKKIGIIEVQRAKIKENNIYVFVPFEKVESLQENVEMTHESHVEMTHEEIATNPVIPTAEPAFSEGDTVLSNYTQLSSKDYVIGLETSRRVPAYFRTYLLPIYQDTEIIEKSYFIAERMFKRCKRDGWYFASDVFTFQQTIMNAATALIKKTQKLAKTGNELDTPIGYFVKTVDKIIDELIQNEIADTFNDDEEATTYAGDEISTLFQETLTNDSLNELNMPKVG